MGKFIFTPSVMFIILEFFLDRQKFHKKDRCSFVKASPAARPLLGSRTQALLQSPLMFWVPGQEVSATVISNGLAPLDWQDRLENE